MSQHLAHMSVQQLKGVGTMLADKLAKLGLYTLQDVLFHLPRDYEDRSHITAIDVVRSGASVLLDDEYNKSPLLYVVKPVPPLIIGTVSIKLLGVK